MTDEELRKLLGEKNPSPAGSSVSKNALASRHIEVFEKMKWEHGPRCFKLCPKKAK